MGIHLCWRNSITWLFNLMMGLNDNLSANAGFEILNGAWNAAQVSKYNKLDLIK